MHKALASILGPSYRHRYARCADDRDHLRVPARPVLAVHDRIAFQIE